MPPPVNGSPQCGGLDALAYTNALGYTYITSQSGVKGGRSSFERWRRTRLTQPHDQSRLTYMPAAEVAQVLAALADPTRRAIVESIRRQPRAVNDIARQFEVSRSAISQHLRVLQEARLLRSQRNGRHNFYALDPHGLTILRAYLDGFWDDVLGAFQAAVMREPRRSKRRRLPPESR